MEFLHQDQWLKVGCNLVSKRLDRGPDQKAIYIEKDIGTAVKRLDNSNLYSVNSN